MESVKTENKRFQSYEESFKDVSFPWLVNLLSYFGDETKINT